MAAPKGNRFWEARSTHGRKPLFQTPDALWDACTQYFVWVEENPLWEEKLFAYQGEVTRGTAYKMRAMTVSGLCLFLDIERKSWDNYRDRKDYLHIVTRVEEIIRDQKFSGAAAELLNPNIIARDLGLRDATHTEHAGTLGITNLTDDELDRRIAQLATQQAAED